MNSKDPSPDIHSQLLIDDDDDEWENELNRERDEILTRFRYVSSSQKNNDEFALKTLSENPWLLQHFPDAIRENETLVSTVVEQKPKAFQWASPKLRGNKAFAIKCALHSGEILEHCSDNLKIDRDVVSSAVSNFGKALQWAHISLRNDKAIVIEALSNSEYAAEWIGDDLASDRKFIQLAAKVCRSIIGHASVDIQSDRNFLLEIIKNSGCNYGAIPSHLQSDLDIMLEAYKHNKSSLVFLPKYLLSNIAFIRQAAKTDGDIYSYATDEIRSDESLFRSAVRNSRDSKFPLLRSAPTKIRANKVLVLLALQFEWRNIEYAEDSLKNDPEVVLAAIRADDSPRSELHHAMHYASDILKNDMAFVKKAVEINWMSFSSANIVLKENVEFVSDLLSIAENVIQFASESVCLALGVPFPTPPHVSANGGLTFRRFILCDSCGHEDHFVFQKLERTVPVYDFDNEFIDFRFELRWCNDCEGLQQTEITYLAKERQQLILAKWGSNAAPKAVHKWANEDRAPRCLNCGAQDLSSMIERRLNATEDGPTIWRHAKCGGRFVIKSDDKGTHFSVRRGDGDDAVEYKKYSHDGFPCRDLRSEFDKKFPELSGQVFTLVESETKHLTMHHNLGQISRRMKLDSTYPELSSAIRKFVREHLGISVLIGSALSQLKSEFPELYLMFRHEARRLIEAARISNINSGGNAAIYLIEPSPPDNEVLKASAPMEHHNSSLHLNPFRFLGVNTRDSSKAILEKAEELALHFNSEQCLKARSDLTNPRSRVGSEVSWLPGVSPRMAEKLVTDLPGKPIEVASQTGLPELARANLMCSALELVDAASVAPQNMARFMLTFGELADEIDIEAVLRDINEDRTVAGFPEVRDISLIEEELNQRKRHYKVVLKNALNKMPSAGLVEAMTILVNESTGEGEHSGPPLIDDLVDSYEVETQGFLAKEHDTIQKLIKVALGAAPNGGSAVNSILEKIEKVVKNWGFVCKPIQVCMKSRGLEHRHSLQVGQELHELVYKLFKEYQMISQSQRISKFLVHIFGDLPEFQEIVQKDVLVLEGIVKKAIF